MTISQADLVEAPERQPVLADGGANRELAERGYVVRPFIGPAEIRELAGLHAELFSDLQSDFVATTVNINSDLRRRTSSRIAEIVGESLRRTFPNHRLVLATFVTKRSRTTAGRVPLHQDWWSVDNRVHRGVQCWCPLTDVGPENACLRVVPGVHQLLNHPYPIHPKFRTPYHPRLGELDAGFSISVPMPAGSALIYDQRMLHGSNDNSSDRVRIAFNCIMNPVTEPSRLYQWDERRPERIQVLEIEDDYFCRFQFGVPEEPPYPPGVRLLETFDARAEPLSDDDFVNLQRIQKSFGLR